MGSMAISTEPSALSHSYLRTYGATGPSFTTVIQIASFSADFSRYTGNPRYSPTGTNRSGEKLAAGPSAYQRAPLNSSHTPFLPLGRGMVSTSLRRLGPRSARPAVPTAAIDVRSASPDVPTATALGDEDIPR